MSKNRTVILIGTLVILGTTLSNYSYSGECTNIRDTRPKTTIQKSSLLSRLYKYFFEDPKVAQEQKLSLERLANEQMAQEQKLKDLDTELQKLADLKSTVSKTESEL